MPEILTARLFLRPPIASDFEAWAGFAADPEVMRFIGGVQPRALAWRGFLTMVGAWQIQGFAMFSVIERSSGRWIGRIGPWQPEGWPGTEVGWGLCRESQGKGYALEAAVASIDWAFEHLGWTEVLHSIDPANTASRALAVRLGSSNRGPGRLPPPFESATIDIWGQSREQWDRHRADRESFHRRP
jgi:RimJ/RimL family protein N-acetyltransferase